MYDVNSPILAEMIYNTPSGGDGNMPKIDLSKMDPRNVRTIQNALSGRGYVPNNPVIETVEVPSQYYPENPEDLTDDDKARMLEEGRVIDSRPIQVSPYPDPYNMITGVGMQNYYPQYNSGYPLPPPPTPIQPQPNYYGYGYPMQNPGFVPQQQFPTPAGMYMDRNQPIQNYGNGHVGVQLPIKDYYNPFMGVGVAYGNAPIGANIYSREQPIEYLTPRDITAKEEGFANAAEKIMNDMTIYKKLCISAYRGAGSSEEELEGMIKYRDKEISNAIDKYDQEKKNANNGYNPISVANMMKKLEDEEKAIPTFTVRIKKGDEVIAEQKTTPTFNSRVYPSYVLANMSRQAAYEKDYKHNMQVYMYNNAVERQLDNMDSIQFFNEGINIVHHRDKEREWYYQAHNSKSLFNPDQFTETLITQYGTPQAKARFYREKARKERRIAENEVKKKENAVNKNEDDFYRTPDGFCLNKKTGEIKFEVPNEIAAANDDRPIVNGAPTDAYRKKLDENIDLKIDDFLDRHVDTPLRRLQNQKRIFNPNGSNSLLLAPSEDEDKHYYGAKGNFLNKAMTMRKFR